MCYWEEKAEVLVENSIKSKLIRRKLDYVKIQKRNNNRNIVINRCSNHM